VTVPSALSSIHSWEAAYLRLARTLDMVFS
jgi:hypothetical protein